MKEKASRVAAEYFEKEKNWNITVKNVGFSTDISRSSINVYGYVTDNKKKEVYANIRYRDDYKIGNTSD
ncbi:hypothetical protein [Bacillus sp. 166amftsu]|uniref:hypothetical protein n=2 Tax=unclassified Bacillus (in: firmicutes) TaxID=185979 RepID=UPI00089D6314|nr:hypothetical protein [Bacillus sp. 166amftsu]SDY39483.1 hypothetical protein SAMN04488156_101183 [Bacillus sp. 166amftsu]